MPCTIKLVVVTIKVYSFKYDVMSSVFKDAIRRLDFDVEELFVLFVTTLKHARGHCDGRLHLLLCERAAYLLTTLVIVAALSYWKS